MKIKIIFKKIIAYFILLIFILFSVSLSFFIAFNYILPLENFSEKIRKYLFMFISALFLSIAIYIWRFISNKYFNDDN